MNGLPDAAGVGKSTRRRRRRVHSTALDRLVKLVAHLRSPKGCPWDRKQTHVSLIKFLREESRELEKALRRGRPHEIEDELGDLLLQVLLHAQIAKESGSFDIQDVALSQHRKLVRRHPHVFGRAKLGTAKAVLDSWPEIKRRERLARSRDLARRL
ncbi:MAG: MazG nucleotide pyrophosphohydrolase domain-containing protein [Elusimicrobia bacterium]|jgi:tetrapyrrole methylase family protein/MazG family protein|nr:MazG nucleotide pyrophosphohydrolase domain-containing protein [Elusimicrobiota bacterium]